MTEKEYYRNVNALADEYISCNGITDGAGRTFVNLGEFLTAIGLDIDPKSSMFKFLIVTKEVKE